MTVDTVNPRPARANRPRPPDPRLEALATVDQLCDEGMPRLAAVALARNAIAHAQMMALEAGERPDRRLVVKWRYLTRVYDGIVGAPQPLIGAKDPARDQERAHILLPLVSAG